jgi:hypothetical protein
VEQTELLRYTLDALERLGVPYMSGPQVDRADVERWAETLGLSPIRQAILSQEGTIPPHPRSE